MADIRRPRYFRYQFLLENDFNDEQAYHVQMRHLQNNYLRSPGVVSGLEVEKVGPKEVRVQPGMAIDETGQEIVVPPESPPLSVPLSSFDPDDEVYIAIQYIEEDDELSEAEIGGSTVCTRVLEKASAFGTTTNPENDPARVCLGKVTLDDSGDIIDSIDFSGRQESTADIAESAVDTDQLAINAVTSAKIDEADGSSGQNTHTGSGVKTGHIQNGAVNEAKLADNAVTSAKLGEADNTTGQNTNSGSGVKTNHIQNLAVTSGKLAANVQATLNNAVPNTGGVINGQLQVRDRLSTYVIATDATQVIGVYSNVQSSGTGNVTGNYTVALGSGAGNKIGMSASAIGAAGQKYGGQFTGKTTGTGSERTSGLHANGSSSGSGVVFGVEASANGSGSGSKYGISARADAAAGTKYGGEFYAQTSGSGGEATYGVHSNANSSGSGSVYGTMTRAWGGGDGTKWGIRAQAEADAGHKRGGEFIAVTSGTGAEVTHGVIAYAGSNGSGPTFGMDTSSGGSGGGTKWGIRAQVVAAEAGHKRGGEFNAVTRGTGAEVTHGVIANASSSGSGPVYGTTTSAGGSGAGAKWGIKAEATGAAGHKYGGQFYALTSGSGAETTFGVLASANSSGSGPVFGTTTSAGGSGAGVKYGINASANAAAGTKYGGRFYALTSGSGSETTYGVHSEAVSSGSGTAIGVRATAYGDGSGNKYAIYGSASGSGELYAGYFDGRVHIRGPLTKPSGSFLIDHVLDPKNKTLRHSFVESPEDLCLYRGKVKLDSKGKATVEMPSYFAALTREEEATVTLTPIGKKPFLAGYEWNKKYSAFTVYGDPDREVSYIVLADRDDPAIHHFRRPVEEAKGDGNFEKGKLIHPEAYGEPPEVEPDVEKEEKEPLMAEEPRITEQEELEKHMAEMEKEDKKRLKAFEAFKQESEQSREELRRAIKEGENVLAALDEESAKERRKLIGEKEVKDREPSPEGGL